MRQMTEQERIEFKRGVVAYYTADYESPYRAPDYPPGTPERAAWEAGWRAAEQTKEYLPRYTPDWIMLLIRESPHGGWFVAFPVDAEHPLVVEEWKCFMCEEPFQAGQRAFVQPYHGEDEYRWVASHDRCMAKALGIEDQVEWGAIR